MTKEELEKYKKIYNERNDKDLIKSCAFYSMSILTLSSNNMKEMLIEKINNDFKDNTNNNDVKDFLLKCIEDYFTTINNAVDLLAFYNEFKSNPILKGFNA